VLVCTVALLRGAVYQGGIAMADDQGKIDIQRFRTLLGMLAEDDDFRARFEANPAGVLTEHGIDFDPTELPVPATLPSKEELKETLEERLQAAQEPSAKLWPIPIWKPRR
jgi:putative modified peptide